MEFFYPRSPCGERHQGLHDLVQLPIHFLSTLSLRRATASKRSEPSSWRLFYPRSPCGERHTGQPVRGLPSFFYPRSPCGERRHCADTLWFRRHFSIHALLAESDSAAPLARRGHWPFLSTLSLRRATPLADGTEPDATFSIHALLAESDLELIVQECQQQVFYPRSPCGERRFHPVYLPR